MTHQGGLADLEASATAADPSSIDVICRLVGKGQVTPVKHQSILGNDKASVDLAFAILGQRFVGSCFPQKLVLQHGGPVA